MGLCGEMLEGLRPYDDPLVDDLSTHEFANRLVPVFAIRKRLGTWEHIHPWVVLPWSMAPECL